MKGIDIEVKKNLICIILLISICIPTEIRAEELNEIEPTNEKLVDSTKEENVETETSPNEEENTEKEEHKVTDNNVKNIETPKVSDDTPSHSIDTKKNGFIDENGNRYYYEQGIMYQGGIRTIDGKEYLFDNSGKMLRGFQQVGDKLYYFGLGSFTKQKNKFFNEGGYRYYFAPDGEVYRDGIKTIDGKEYLFDKDGKMLKGFQVAGNHLYYFGLGSFTQQKNKFFDEGGYRYYFAPDGEVYRNGIKTIDGKEYLFDQDGRMLKGFQVVGNHLYYFGRGSFIQQKGRFLDEGGYRYYFGLDGEVYRDGVKSIDGKEYLFDSEGRMLKGFQVVGNHLYYFGRGSFTQQKGRFLDEGGYRYYFGVDGEVYRDGVKSIDGKEYLFDSEGRMLKGFQVVGNHLYYFGRGSFTQQKGRFLDEGGYRYYFGLDGEVYRGGIKTVDGKEYGFDDKGRMLKGHYWLNGNLYYFGFTYGDMQKNHWYIEKGKNKYYFGNDGVAYRSGLTGINGKEYYFENDGTIVTGVKEISGNINCFGVITGIKQFNTWYHLNANTTYYVDASGNAYRNGNYKIREDLYVFDWNGKLKTGWQQINGHKYYFYPNGTKAKNICMINGNEYHFDSNGILQYIQYLPKYYNQKDVLWRDIQYGLSTLGSSGCAPTSIAMAFSSILERTVLPTEIANYLYYYTNEYNKSTSGTGGMGIRYAAEHYGIKWRGLSNVPDIDAFLKRGAIVFASMGNGHYGTPRWNHAIVFYGYHNGNTYVLGPLDASKSGYMDTSTLWRERSTDPDDLRGGYAFYALFK